MTLDQRIADAARHVADGVVVPEVDLDAVRSKARANQRQKVALAVTVVVVAIIVTGTAVVSGRNAGTPEPADPVDPPKISGPPLTPYWHDGVLHVRDVEIETPWRRSPSIEVAGDTVLAGLDGYRGVDPGWALVDGDRLAPVPVSDMYPRLSVDGRIAYWWTYPDADATRVVTWDTETNQELASRDLPGNDGDGGPGAYLAVIDGDGIAYWVDESSETPVTRWDVRADTVEPMPDLRPSDLDPYDPDSDFFRDQFVSPDGMKEMFTGYAEEDTIMPPDPEIWVRPVGSTDPSDVVGLRVPESRYNEPLYDYETNRGALGVWWETNETVLVTVLQESGGTDLLRCTVTDGACARVFELAAPDSGVRGWSFARFPTTG